MDVQFKYMCTFSPKSIYVHLNKSTDIPLRVPLVGITMNLIYIKDLWKGFSAAYEMVTDYIYVLVSK